MAASNVRKAKLRRSLKRLFDAISSPRRWADSSNAWAGRRALQQLARQCLQLLDLVSGQLAEKMMRKLGLDGHETLHLVGTSGRHAHAQEPTV